MTELCGFEWFGGTVNLDHYKCGEPKNHGNVDNMGRPTGHRAGRFSRDAFTRCCRSTTGCDENKDGRFLFIRFHRHKRTNEYCWWWACQRQNNHAGPCNQEPDHVSPYEFVYGR